MVITVPVKVPEIMNCRSTDNKMYRTKYNKSKDVFPRNSEIIPLVAIDSI